MFAVSLLLACGATQDVPGTITEAYDVRWVTTPSPAIAGQEVDFQLTVLGLDGEPVQDLQVNHDRLVHTVFISSDLKTFLHRHQEDVRPVTADQLRAGTLSFPVTFPTSGRYRVAFDFAHQNLWLQTTDFVDVAGEPRQEEAPDLSGGATWEGDGIQATLSWTGPAQVGGEAAWEVTLRTSEGDDITDLTQWLASDGHCVFASADLAWVSHTHAWFSGVGDMAPSMEMPHLYSGPTVPFRAWLPVGGDWRMWCQFARASAPDDIITVTFPFVVTP